MGEFISTAFGFPTALFSFMLLVVFAYWIFVVLGAVGMDALDVDVDADADSAGGLSGLLSATGLSGVPVTVVLSLLITLSWFATLVGTVLLDLNEASTPALIGLGLVVLVAAVLFAWLVTSGVVMGLRRFLPGDEPGAARTDFVGTTCVIRTGRADEAFGQAEITAANGTASIVQVRTIGGEALTSGDTGLVFDYDADNEVYLVTPFDRSLDPGSNPA
ncbi:DUF1449 domain-containing protein [Nocardiopsis gilva YIM 90087]|uniref:DUF1449 domain-containing protein n=1 Tax=Nocardiopsis gilva YIM 90087 TaxID=1235441 RepID=A0A223S1S0_9ACTN|nr:OB-fold-containig protein [Nocardiopsis gilva]ASU82065.1 DUF1449 domain-containing protein [Nocardiopsis gilva YIM 90087]